MAATQVEANGAQPVIRPAICMGGKHNGIHALTWLIKSTILPPQGCVSLLHVKRPLRSINNPLGIGKIAVDHVGPRWVKEAEKKCNEDIEKLTDGCIKICEKYQVTFKLFYSENDLIHRGIVDQISKLGITNLILEKSSHNFVTRALRGESISEYVAKHAPDCCEVMIVRNGRLHSVIKEAIHTPSRSSETNKAPMEHAKQYLLMANAGFNNGERSVQRPVDPSSSSTPGIRLSQSLSMDNSQGSSENLISNNNDNVRYQDTAAMLKTRSLPPNRMAEIAPASPFHQHPHPYNHNNSESNNGNFGIPSTEVQGSSASLYCTPEERPGQTLLIDSDMAFYSCEVIPTLELDSLHSRLHEARQSADRAQREAERQASSSRKAEEVVAMATKMIAEHVRQRDKAVIEANMALQKASEYEKQWKEAVWRQHETQNELETQEGQQI